MNNGNINIIGSGNKANNESRGIVVEGSESSNNPGEGYIIINGGIINITSVSKGITAKWDSKSITNGGDAEDDDLTNDPYPYVKINDGSITITTNGKQIEQSTTSKIINADGVEVIEKRKNSPEGIEGKQAIFINGGEIKVASVDDSINSSTPGSSHIEINGGLLYLTSANEDVLDCNGDIEINGGTVVAVTNACPQRAFDCDVYNFQMRDSLVMGFGTEFYSEPNPETSNQGVVITSSYLLNKYGKTFAITDTEGTVVYAGIVPNIKTYENHICTISSSKLLSGKEYTLHLGAILEGGQVYNGLYTEMPTLIKSSSKIEISFKNSLIFTTNFN